MEGRGSRETPVSRSGWGIAVGRLRETEWCRGAVHAAATDTRRMRCPRKAAITDSVLAESRSLQPTGVAGRVADMGYFEDAGAVVPGATLYPDETRPEIG